MIELKTETKIEEIEIDKNNTEKIEILEITAETSYPQTNITFYKDDEVVAVTNTDNEGVAVMGVSVFTEPAMFSVSIENETEHIEVN